MKTARPANGPQFAAYSPIHPAYGVVMILHIQRYQLRKFDILPPILKLGSRMIMAAKQQTEQFKGQHERAAFVFIGAARAMG